MNQYQTRVQCIKSSGYIKPPPPYVLYCALNSAPKGAGEKRKGEEKEKEKNPPDPPIHPSIPRSRALLALDADYLLPIIIIMMMMTTMIRPLRAPKTRAETRKKRKHSRYLFLRKQINCSVGRS
jgi:hypothetical protein